MEKSVAGLDENIVGAFAYALGWVSGIAFLLMEPSNKFVRFHAWQSVIVFGGLSLAWLILVSVVLLGSILAWVVVVPLSAVLWLLLMFKAYQGERYRLPFAGDIAAGRQ